MVVTLRLTSGFRLFNQLHDTLKSVSTVKCDHDFVNFLKKTSCLTHENLKFEFLNDSAFGPTVLGQKVILAKKNV